MELLRDNWIWILLALGAVWFLFRRGAMGCGMGSHQSHGSAASGESHPAERSGVSLNGQKSDDVPERRVAAPRSRRHGGGC